jgi:hypothetical protein
MLCFIIQNIEKSARTSELYSYPLFWLHQRYPHTDVGRGQFCLWNKYLRSKAVVLATVPCPYQRAVAGRGTASGASPFTKI